MGISVKDLINIDWKDINKMNQKELKHYVQFGAMQANRYLKRAEKTGFTSPGLFHAQKRAEEKGRYYTSKGLTTNQLRTELKDIISFLDNKTITKSGAEEFFQQSLDRVNKRAFRQPSKDISKDDLNAMWDLYKKYVELNKSSGTAYFGALGSSKIQQLSYNFMNDFGWDIMKSGYKAEDLLEYLDSYITEKVEDYDYDWLSIEKEQTPFAFKGGKNV